MKRILFTVLLVGLAAGADAPGWDRDFMAKITQARPDWVLDAVAASGAVVKTDDGDLPITTWVESVLRARLQRQVVLESVATEYGADVAEDAAVQSAIEDAVSAVKVEAEKVFAAKEAARANDTVIEAEK